MKSIEERLTELETEMRTVKGALFDNGHEGLITRFNRFETKWTTREDDKKVYDDRQAWKTNIIIAILTLIALAIGSWAAVRALNHESLLRLDSGNPIQTAFENATAR